ncbi:tetraacyldisaccharide 4'-kinase [Psychrobacter frigidicola]|uniref:Tetraacyldisaccharide 4'-kinase n=1 Tax=Psychrobacter frigidicola TaxID=45611 RepID=A0A5C7A6M8_9GAMM|nr:tetraacyldisaccharide 4'-kinase [Psychrobacter frigidicola]TXD98144.1 tetraacyldisaccharide 4'-kinase [Psychrobacter frigidicola]
MSMETAVTRAWQRQAGWLWLLLPISWLYGLLILLRRQAYKVGLFSSYHAPIPVLVIGNITVGGSGKTPLIMTLVNYLQQRSVQVGVISRGYGGDSSKMPVLVTTDSLPSDVGDEPYLIVSTTGVAMAVCPNRQQAIETLLQAHPNLQLIIADDGLQHYALQRDIEWIVVDAARGFGSQQLLPTGFLREPISRLKNATVIYHEKADEHLNLDSDSFLYKHLAMQLHPDSLQPLYPELFKLTELLDSQLNGSVQAAPPIHGSQVHAVSGIGYPQRFFATLNSLGFDVIEHPYPDHYDFSVNELLQYTEQPIIVTSKDAVKVRALLLQATNSQAQNTEWQELVSRLWVLPVTAILSTNCYQTLQQQLIALGIDIADK